VKGNESKRPVKIASYITEWYRLLGWPAPVGYRGPLSRPVRSRRFCEWYEGRLPNGVTLLLSTLPKFSASVLSPELRIMAGGYRVELAPGKKAVVMSARRYCGIFHAMWFSSPQGIKEHTLLHPSHVLRKKESWVERMARAEFPEAPEWLCKG
jgi:hypothetical protein